MLRSLIFALALAGCHTARIAPATTPASIEVDGDPNGLFWDATTLYIADSDHDRILGWTDSVGIKIVATLPLVSGRGPGLGQVVRTRDGTLVVTRFGFGTAGDVAYAREDGSVGVVSGLAPARRRIGLTIAPDGRLYDGWFEKNDNGLTGRVARLALDGHEDVIIDGLEKPVGVLVSGDTVYVSDQAAGRILRATIASGATQATPFSTEVPGVDLLCPGPDGSLFAGGASGVVYRVTKDGHAQVFVSGLSKVRGVAYDPSGRRLFVAEHGGEAGGRHRIRILPVP